MNLDVTLGQLLAMLLPTSVLGLISFFFRRTLDEISSNIKNTRIDLEKVGEKVDGHNSRVAVLEAKVELLEAELGAVRGSIELLRGILDRRKGR